jgi:hypothetical protein
MLHCGQREIATISAHCGLEQLKIFSKSDGAFFALGSP